MTSQLGMTTQSKSAIEIDLLASHEYSSANLPPPNLSCLTVIVHESLHLIPDSVRELNFSRCALGIEGTETLCEFMAGNKHIQVLNIQYNVLLWRRVAGMIYSNDTLRSLHLSPCVLSEHCMVAGSVLCIALRVNSTLQSLSLYMRHPGVHSFALMHHYFFTQRFARRLAGRDASLRVLRFCGSPLDESRAEIERSITTPSMDCRWSNHLRENENLSVLEGCNIVDNPLVVYYLELNSVRARQVVREPSSVKEWGKALTSAAKDEKLNALCCLLVNKPGYCGAADAASARGVDTPRGLE